MNYFELLRCFALANSRQPFTNLFRGTSPGASRRVLSCGRELHLKIANSRYIARQWLGPFGVWRSLRRFDTLLENACWCMLASLQSGDRARGCLSCGCLKGLSYLHVKTQQPETRNPLILTCSNDSVLDSRHFDCADPAGNELGIQILT